MSVKGITSAMWGLSVAGPGQTVQGVDEVNQTISTILCTPPGSDPLRPLFGCGLHDLLDRPSSQVGPQLAQSIAQALRIWEPRIEVLRIKYSLMAEHIFFEISWKLRVGVGAGDAALLVGLFDGLVKSPLFENLVPYISAVLATETYEPVTTETGAGITI
jgi:uncharacterized protein